MYYSVLPDRPMPNQTIYITNPGNTALCNLFNSVLDWVVAIYYEAGSQKYNNLPNTRNCASNDDRTTQVNIVQLCTGLGCGNIL